MEFSTDVQIDSPARLTPSATAKAYRTLNNIYAVYIFYRQADAIFSLFMRAILLFYLYWMSVHYINNNNLLYVRKIN